MRYIVAIVVIFLIIIFGVIIFGRGGSKKAPVTKFLADYASTAVQVQLTTDGNINGDDAHRQVVIVVGQNERTLTVIQGYQGTVLKSETLPNNQAAYSAFLSAIDVAGFANIRKSKFSSEAGQCPLGQRFIYQITHNDNDNVRSWSTSCGNNGTFAGRSSLVRQLFQRQITNYSEYTSDVNL